MSPPDDATISEIATGIRLHATRMIALHGFGYLGQALSSAELFAALGSGYWRPGGRDTDGVRRGSNRVRRWVGSSPVSSVAPQSWQ